MTRTAIFFILGLFIGYIAGVIRGVACVIMTVLLKDVFKKQG